MEETPQTQTPTPSTPQPTDQQPSPQSPAPPQPLSASLPLPSSSLPPTSSSTIPSSLNPNPSSPITQPQTRHPFNRPWQQPSPFQHFPSHLQSVQTPHSASSSSNSTPPEQRGGMAIGVPAPPPTSFSSLNQPSFGQQFGGLARNATNVSESVPGPSTSQMVRQPVQGIQGMGSMGSFSSGSQLRPSGIAVHHQQRPAQPSPRALTTPNNQSSASQVQNFQGHGTLRASSLGPPVSPSPSTSQGLQPHNQPWLSSGPQGKPPLPSPPFRAQMNPPSLPQRSHISQQHHHSLSTAAQQPQSSSSQPPPTTSGHQPQEHYGQQFPSSRVTQSLSHQQSTPRGPGLGNQKSSSQPVVQPSPVQSVTPNRTIVIPETGESCSRILSKRSIQELVTQIDPSLKLDPEVEDILVDIADEFVESITTFGCSLAKHRKSSTLEAKDILLHLERNWNMTLPGFSGDEIKIYRKPFASDIHKERLAAVKRSIASSETAINRNSAGQAAGSTKGHLPKAPANFIGSPNPKMREVA